MKSYTVVLKTLYEMLKLNKDLNSLIDSQMRVIPHQVWMD